MREFPVLNSQLDEAGQNLIFKKFFNVGFAADTPNGLLVPVIKGADKLDVFAVAKALGDSERQGARRQTTRRRHAGRGVHDLESGRHRRHAVHAHHQFARSRHPRRIEVGDEAGVGRQAVRAAAHAAAVVLLRSSRHRRRASARASRSSWRIRSPSLRISSGRCREQDRPDGSGSRQFRRGRHRRRARESGRQDRSRNAAGHARNRQGHDGCAVDRRGHRDRSAGEEGRQDRQGRFDRAHRGHCRPPRRPPRRLRRRAALPPCREGGAGTAPLRRRAARCACPRRSRRSRSSPTCRTIAKPSCWCSAPVPVATPPHSAPPISASRSRWSSAGPCWAASASTSAAFHRRRCCTPPRSSTKSARCAITASTSARRRSTCPSCSTGRTAWSANWSMACRCWRSSARSKWCRAWASSPARTSIEVTGAMARRRRSASSNASSRPAPRPSNYRSFPTIRASSIRPVRSSWAACRSACWSSAAASSASRWPPCTRRSARSCRWSSSPASSCRAPIRTW